jgi:hypothetical protein
MGSMDGLLVCSDPNCGNPFYSLGQYDAEGGHLCGVCEVHQTHEFLLCKHAAQWSLLASGRSTSRFLHLFRSGQHLWHRLADMSVGTLGSAMQKYVVRLQRANLRLMLSGGAYGFRPVFLQLDRQWARPFNTEQDCLDLVLDFLVPSDDLRG